MKHWLVTLASFALVSCAGMGAKPPSIKEDPVTYRDGATTLKGFVVYDEARQDRRPGVLVVHEWWGITPHVRGEARKFAEQGYTYPGAVHAFTNPEATGIGKKFKIPIAYHPEVDRQAKAEAANFFAEVFRK